MQVIQTTQVRQVEGVESSSQETRAERPFRRAGALDFSPHPFAVHAVLRENQQQAVVDLDGPVDSTYCPRCTSSGANQTIQHSPNSDYGWRCAFRFNKEINIVGQSGISNEQ